MPIARGTVGIDGSTIGQCQRFMAMRRAPIKIAELEAVSPEPFIRTVPHELAFSLNLSDSTNRDIANSEVSRESL